MKKRILTLAMGGMVVALLLLPLGIDPVQACKSAGPNKHVGVLIGVSSDSFVLRDAETQKELTFQASNEIIQKLEGKQRVVISFEEKDGKLIAVGVHS